MSARPFLVKVFSYAGTIAIASNRRSVLYVQSHQMSKKSKNKAKDKLPTSESTSPVRERSGAVVVSVLAKPGAKQNSVTGISEEGVGIQVAAPPVDGEANTELVKYMSKLLGLRKSDVTLEKGSRSRSKQFLVTGISKDEVISRLKTEMDS